ncbi:MAG: DNA repair protein RecO [Synergistaceae bacterium]|nr:DNA repair protein RecO [Synergistaceae bacterium]
MIPDAKESELLKQGYYTASGTVLKRKEGMKNSQSLLLFLKGYGIVWVSAPSGSKSRFAGAEEPMVWGSYELYKSPGRFYVKNAEIKEDFLSVRSSPKKLTTALRLYQLISQTIYQEHENDKALNLLWSCMLLLDSGCPAETVNFRFIWRLLKYLGLAPSLTNCVSCSAQLKTAFAAHDGLLCEKCAAEGCKISAGQLVELQTAAMLPQEKFAEWAKGKTGADNLDIEIFEECSKYLKTFFDGLG